MANRKPWKISGSLATVDHNIPTQNQELGLDGIKDEIAMLQIKALDDNCDEFGITEYKLNDPRQGIVHVISPEQGFTLPGTTMVCGDSHTSTHGAFGAIACGIGTSEVEHVLATQCLSQKKVKNMQITYTNKLSKNTTAKDLILDTIAKIGTDGGTGYAIEFMGEAIECLSMESRMTICNMAIEAGAKFGLIACDNTTIEYIKKTPSSPKGEELEKAIKYWKTLQSDKNAKFDKRITIDASKITPQISWGTSPEMTIGIEQNVPNIKDAKTPEQQISWEGAIKYTNITAGKPLLGTPINAVFIGSCTNSRIEDLRLAAQTITKIGKKISPNITQALVVPGSWMVKKQAEKENLDKIFIEAGFDWRQPGCSMCLGMNQDRLKPNDRCVSTSNRNFEGRQGKNSITHLVNPAIAVACAIAGKITNT
jgi:3-isopropylmalate/(R)-2-methylmalate dehydratase large subunit